MNRFSITLLLHKCIMKKSVVLMIVTFGLIVSIFAVFALNRWYPTHGHADWDEVQQFTADKIPVNPKDFRSDFEEIFEQVKKKYPYITKKHINLDSIHTTCLQRIDTMQSKVAYSLLIMEFFANLKCTHANNENILYPWFIQGDNIIVIGNRVFVNHPSVFAIKAGLQDKDEIVTVDGVPTNKWVMHNSKYVSASTDATRYLLSALTILCSYTSPIKTLGIIRHGKPITITIHLQSKSVPTKAEEQNVTWRKVSSRVGYINVKSMQDNADTEFTKALKHLSKLPYLIVDVRQNGGGNSWIGDNIAQNLIKGKRRIWNGSTISPSTNSYKGKVIILMGHYSCSSAETFLITMKESGDAVLVGTSSAGDTGGIICLFKTSHGIFYRLPVGHSSGTSPKGFPLEGKGISPNYLVSMKVNDFLSGKDTQLSYALQLLQK